MTGSKSAGQRHWGFGREIRVLVSAPSVGVDRPASGAAAAVRGLRRAADSLETSLLILRTDEWVGVEGQSCRARLDFAKRRGRDI